MPTRRDILMGGAALAAAALIEAPASGAVEDDLGAALGKATRGSAINRGRVSLSIPAIAESGQSVFTTVEVVSPMTADDHVRAIHLFSEKNPVSHITSFHLGPRAGRAKVSTNIRLAASQRVTAVAEISNGSFWSDEKNVIVTIAACIDGG